MYNIKFLDDANKDISDISRYIGVELCSPVAADRLVDKILSEITKLSDMPYMYGVYESPVPIKVEFRKFIVKNYAVFYYIDESEKVIKIAHVVYARRNFSNVLK